MYRAKPNWGLLANCTINCFSLPFLHQTEFRQKNAGKRTWSSKSKEANGKGTRKEPPAADGEEEQDGANSDEGEDGADWWGDYTQS